MIYAWLAGLKHVFQTATHKSRKIKSSRSWVRPLKGLSSLITVIMFLFLCILMKRTKQFIPWTEPSTIVCCWADEVCTECMGMNILRECYHVSDHQSHLIMNVYSQEKKTFECGNHYNVIFIKLHTKPHLYTERQKGGLFYTFSFLSGKIGRLVPILTPINCCMVCCHGRYIVCLMQQWNDLNLHCLGNSGFLEQKNILLWHLTLVGLGGRGRSAPP